MRLLIITQKVDRDDSVLGFFHGWITEFAAHCESILVVCLEEGRHELPANVRVLSLGKEKHKSRVRYIANFYKYIWSERGDYDAVFVHMNQEYVLLGSVFWRLIGKTVYMWRNHVQGNIFTRVAVTFSHRVFCTSPQSFTARFSKTLLMPVGIDTDLFTIHSDLMRRKNGILCLGRISPVKKIEDIIGGVATLVKDGFDVHLSIVGESTLESRGYHEGLIRSVMDAGLSEVIEFKPAVPHDQVVGYFSSHNIYANATPVGSADKTIFEAMACGAIVVVRNGDMLRNVTRGAYVFTDPNSLVMKLKGALEMNDADVALAGESLRRYVVDNHGLRTLSAMIFAAMGEIAGVK